MSVWPDWHKRQAGEQRAVTAWRQWHMMVLCSVRGQHAGFPLRRTLHAPPAKHASLPHTLPTHQRCAGPQPMVLRQHKQPLHLAHMLQRHPRHQLPLPHGGCVPC